MVERDLEEKDFEEQGVDLIVLRLPLRRSRSWTRRHNDSTHPDMIVYMHSCGDPETDVENG